MIDQLVAESGTPTGDLVSKAVYPSGPGGLNGALDIFSKVIDGPIVRKYNEGVFVGKFPTGGDVVFRAVSSFPSTPVLQLNNVLGFPDILKIHFP